MPTTSKLRETALDQSLVTTGFKVVTVGGTQIDYAFNTMPGNQPKNYGDAVFIWQTPSHDIPRGPAPMNTDKPQVDTPDGTGVFGGLTVTSESYLLAYAVGPDVKNACATVFVPKLGQGDPETWQPSVTLTVVGSTSVSFQYSMPGGSLPQSDGDWAGLWQGQPPASLYTVPPKWFTAIGQDASSGSYFINNVSILRGMSYTLGYFKGGYAQQNPKQTTLACAVTFGN